MASTPAWHQVGGSAAERYERDLVPAMFAPWAPVLLEHAGVQTGERVLDVACGTGVVARLAASRVGALGRVVGLDNSTAMLDVARSLPSVPGTVIEWLEASVLEIPLDDASFDVVLCAQGLQQFPDRTLALSEMRRVLAPGGRLAASVWSHIEGSPGMAALVAALERHVGQAAADNRRAPFSLGDANELRHLVEGAEFRNVQVSTLRETARFASPDALVEAQLAATPLSTLGSLSDAVRRVVVRDVRESLRGYWHDGQFAVLMEAHVVIARA